MSFGLLSWQTYKINVFFMKMPIIIAAVVVLVFIMQSLFPSITDYLSLNKTALYEPWRIITYAFAHANAMHIFYNIFALVLFGLILENIIGPKNFVKIYFSGIIVSGAVALLFYSSIIGASGAVFAVLGCLTVLRPKLIVWVYGIPMPMVMAAFVWIAIDIFGMVVPSNVANAGHIAGILFGIIVGTILRKKYSER